MFWKTWTASFGVCLIGCTAIFAEPSPNCATDGTMEVCVVSAAIAGSNSKYMNGDFGVDVFLTLRITNLTKGTFNLAQLEGEMSFMPGNAPSISPAANLRISGLRQCNMTCNDPSSQAFTAFSPSRPLFVQYAYQGRASEGALEMLKLVKTAVFTATLSIGESGRQRFIPLPAPQFAFSNGLAKH
jgi:hypothetical protein